jgi:hypothetical protein
MDALAYLVGLLSNECEVYRTLRDHAPNYTQPSQLSTRLVCFIGPRPLQIRPAQETPRPVPLARLVAVAEFVEVYGLIRLIQRIRAIRAAIIGQA